MKKYIVLMLNVFLFNMVLAEETQTLTLAPDEIEVLFFKQNLQLIAENMNIELADAEITQAKLWDNPTLSIGDVNLWSTRGQREGKKEAIPPLFGFFARNTQFSIELSQLIQISGKRQKLVRRERVSKAIAIQEFEDLLRNLKVELRKSIHEIIYIQAYQKTLENQIEVFSQIVEKYKHQVMQRNFAKHELLRLQASLFELENEFQENQISLNEQLKILRTLLGLKALTSIEIKDRGRSISSPQNMRLDTLIGTALENRPDIKLSELQIEYFEKSLSYEKSHRIPDLTLSVQYDRFGGVWKDFIGFGIAIGLPILDLNQGKIKTARISQKQRQHMARQKQNQAQHEIAEFFNNYSQAYDFYNKINDSVLSIEFDNMLEIYAKNFLNRNISMLEYVDFMETYKSNKQIFLKARKNLNIQLEELQHKVGSDIQQ